MFCEKISYRICRKIKKLCDLVISTPNLSEDDKEDCKDEGQSFEEFKAELIREAKSSATAN